jgi:xanthine dehydrogenase YagS FAD-binding subunit
VASVAVVVQKGEDGKLMGGRVVLGGVAPVPWLAPKASEALTGSELSEAAFGRIAELALEGAQPLAQNGYKVPLTKSLVRKALRMAVNA